MVEHETPGRDIFGPFVDQTFRLVEMIGIVALLAVALAGRGTLSRPSST